MLNKKMLKKLQRKLRSTNKKSVLKCLTDWVDYLIKDKEYPINILEHAYFKVWCRKFNIDLNKYKLKVTNERNL
ncbi:MAG: hypothetical protein EOM78_18630 [Erysipelotrichia bacterium]|nr:hypothetical protein [Erysipelotrichia bacterium]